MEEVVIMEILVFFDMVVNFMFLVNFSGNIIIIILVVNFEVL